MKLRFHYLAVDEMEEGIRWYSQDSIDAPVRFSDEVDETFQRIRTRPQQFPFVDKDHQRAVLVRFPYYVIFRAVDTDIILIVAVAHAKRKPGYWSRRSRVN